LLTSFDLLELVLKFSQAPTQRRRTAHSALRNRSNQVVDLAA
jgi:hypothetical protein